MTDLKYQSNTERLLLDGAKWLVHSGLRQSLEEIAVLDLKTRLAHARTSAYTELGQLQKQLSENIKLVEPPVAEIPPVEQVYFGDTDVFAVVKVPVTQLPIALEAK